MTLARRIHSEATSELLDAAKWYETEQTGLGEDFLAAIEAAVQGVLNWPQAAPVFLGWNDEPVVRSKSVRVFPYRVLYYVTDTSVVILAYAHQRRRPGYWQYLFDR